MALRKELATQNEGQPLDINTMDFRQVSEDIVLAMKKRVYSNVTSQSGTTTNALEDLERLSVLTSSPSVASTSTA
uniref:Uncharacterized protein n=1 Tax=Timema douglasi TaxID=61478 RepID=A0A7R8Z3T7_TIMDO|nr:unnamed protein product [Timema douglasi]